MVSNDARRVSKTLGTGQYVDAPFGGVVKDVHASCRDEIERLQALVEHLSSQLRLQLKANDKAWEAYKEVVGDDG